MFVSKNLKIILGMDRKFVKAQQRLRLGSLTQPRRPMVSRVGMRTAARNFTSSSRALASLKKAETGYLDLAGANYALDTTGSVTLLNAVPQGASVSQRVGKKIVAKSIQLRGLILANTATTYADTSYLVVYDRRPTAALPAISDILKSASSFAFNNDDNAGRFKILRRRDTVLSGNITTPATGNEVADVDDFVKVNLPTVYKALGTGAIADIEEGAIYLVTIGDHVTGTTAATLATTVRFRFQDI